MRTVAYTVLKDTFKSTRAAYDTLIYKLISVA